MDIRQDFLSARIMFERLWEYGNTFGENSRKEWKHLKHDEDFYGIYEMEEEYRYTFEKLYEDGKSLAFDMSIHLQEFNNINEYPTLKSYIASFDNWLLPNINELMELSRLSAQKRDGISECPWVIVRMIRLFDKQIELLKSVAATLEMLKTTEIYKTENGDLILKNDNVNNIYNISDVNNSAININSPSAKASVDAASDSKNISLQLVEIFQSAQFADEAYRLQSLEILNTILDEIQKPQPKKFAIGSMVSKLSSLMSLATSIDKIAPGLLDKIKQYWQ